MNQTDLYRERNAGFCSVVAYDPSSCGLLTIGWKSLASFGPISCFHASCMTEQVVTLYQGLRKIGSLDLILHRKLIRHA